ncbi:MAG: hypothetical protein ACOYNY_01840 [Caldilineaceae bacterium]
MPLINVFLPNNDRSNHHHCTLHPSNQQQIDQLQSANEQFVAASISFGLATVGALLAPPLLYGCIPAIAYLTVHSLAGVLYYQGRKSWYIATQPSTSAASPSPSPGVTRGNRSPASPLSPLYARVQRVDGEIEILVAALQPDDIVLVQAGELIPVAGRIICGSAWIATQAGAPDAKMLIKRPGNYVQADQLVLAGSISIALQRTEH